MPIEIDGKEYMRDAKGRLIPMETVKEEDAARDGLVRELFNKALALQGEMKRFRLTAMGDIMAFVDLMLEKYEAKLGGDKGNITLTSYDGSLRVQVAVSEKLEFGEQLQAAKNIINELLAEWTEDSRPEIKAIITDAFQADAANKLDTGRILSLRSIKIDDPRWHRAMEAISDSLRPVGSKTYIRFYRRREEDGKFEAVSLDMAAF